MHGALIFIGDELLSGAIQNLNSYVATCELTSYGFNIEEIITLPDKIPLIMEYLKKYIEKYDFIITSGGLGPTEDDLTNLAVAKAFNLELIQHPEFASAISSSKDYGESQKIAQKMSILPKGAVPLSEDLRIAGYYLNVKNKIIFFLPGVPSQFSQLLKTKVIPLLLRNYPETRTKVFKVLRFFDINETDLNLFIAKLPSQLKESVKIGYYPAFPEVKMVLQSEYRNSIEKIIKNIKDSFEIYLVSEENENLPQVIGKLLKEKKETLGVAESCTGGTLSSLITSVSGSSEYFERGFITYSPKSKIEELGVNPQTIEKFGVVSFETALEMAEGVKNKAKVDYALALTGFAGPTGGTEDNPVGTVYIGFTSNKECRAFKFIFPGDRREVQILASFTALDILRRYILYDKKFFSYRFATGIKEKTISS